MIFFTVEVRRRWWLMDMETIQISKTHTCIREVSLIRMFDPFGYMLNVHAVPCIDYDCMALNYKNAFQFCFKFIHKLPFYPKTNLLSKNGSMFSSTQVLSCSNVENYLLQFIGKNDIVLYKGGIHEKRFCEKMEIFSFNVELFGVPKVENIISPFKFGHCGGHVDDGEIRHCPSIEIMTFHYYLCQFCMEDLFKLKNTLP